MYLCMCMCMCMRICKCTFLREEFDVIFCSQFIEMVRSKKIYVVKSSRGFIPTNRKSERKRVDERAGAIAMIKTNAKKIAYIIAAENKRQELESAAETETETDILYWTNHKHAYDPHEVRYFDVKDATQPTVLSALTSIAKRIGQVVKKCEPETPWTDRFIQYLCLKIDDAVDLYTQLIYMLPRQSYLYHQLMNNNKHISRTSDFIEESTLTTHYTNQYYARYLYMQLCDLYVIIDAWTQVLPDSK